MLKNCFLLTKLYRNPSPILKTCITERLGTDFENNMSDMKCVLLKIDEEDSS